MREVVPYLPCDAPIVASVDESLAFAPTALLIGVAPPGGALPASWRAELLRALAARLDVVAGLHDFLGNDAEFVAAAARAGARLVDLRTPPPPRLFDGSAYRVAARVALTVGTDCAVGKMTAALELTRAARARGVAARFVATGQTGIAIAGGGAPIDRVIADFASGAAEELVVTHAPGCDVLFVEGQGGIAHPAFAPVTLALLYGAAPDALVLVHLATRTHVDDLGTPLPSLSAAIELYEALCAGVKPARVAGIALNTVGLDDAGACGAIARARAETGLPCDDVVRNGPHALYGELAPAFAAKTAPLS